MDKLLTVSDIAAILKLSPWTIGAWCSQKRIPFIKLGRTVRLRISTIERWLRQKEKQAHPSLSIFNKK